MIDQTWLKREIESCERWIDHLNAKGQYDDTAFVRGSHWAYREVLKRLLEAEMETEDENKS